MNKTYLVTGTTNGIGKALVEQLAALPNATILLVSRDSQKLRQQRFDLRKINPRLRVFTYTVDFSNLSQMQKVSRLISYKHRFIDVLINNAGLWNTKKIMTPQNIEETWAVNYLAPFILTYNLRKNLLQTAKQTNDVRIINVASEAHRYSKLKNISFTEFGLQTTYADTKLANILFSNKFAEILRNHNISSYAVHPGVIATGLWQKMPKFIAFLLQKFLSSPKKGAETLYYLATTEKAPKTGTYWNNLKETKTSNTAKNTELQEELYQTTKSFLKEYLV